MRHDRSVPRPPHVAVATTVALVLATAGCGADTGDRGASAAAPTTTGAATPRPTATSGPNPAQPSAPATVGPDAAPSSTSRPGPTTTSSGPAAAVVEDAPPPDSWTATCPTPTKSPLGCRAVRGRVLAIQSYDPDGDGDLHVIAVGGDVTAPGITVFDVRTPLRPRRDPVKGEYVTGAGPVFRGSLKQRQIQVDAFKVWRPRR